MKILILGAEGFLGRHLARACAAAGHGVRRGVRRSSQPGDVAVDYRADLDAACWMPRLAGVDAVINAVGLLREQRPGDFERVHHLAPRALFAACAAAGIRRVVQISALGAESGLTPYLASKARGDGALAESVPTGFVLRPSLVFGADGISARFFLGLASCPLLLLPDGGRQRVQPIHVDDLCDAVLRLLTAPAGHPRVMAAVGPTSVGFAGMLAGYRRALGWTPARVLSFPATCMPRLAAWTEKLPGSLLTRDTWTMLTAGNVGDPRPLARLLGRQPREVAQFLAPSAARDFREKQAWRLGTGLARWALALLWLGSAVASLVSWPLSLELLAPLGLAGDAAWTVLCAAVGLDVLLGVLTLLRPGLRLWAFQAATIVAYSILVLLWLPGFWLHPFAPLLKNLPVLALLGLLALDRETTS